MPLGSILGKRILRVELQSSGACRTRPDTKYYAESRKNGIAMCALKKYGFASKWGLDVLIPNILPQNKAGNSASGSLT
jgi:hypothetical protein